MIGEAITGMNALKTALDMARALKDINDAAARNAAVIELQQKILDAQTSQFELLRRVDDLEKQISAADKKSEQFARYLLTDYGARTFAYELRADAANGEPIHRACAKCFQERQISILQFSHKGEGQDWFDCLRCNSRQKFGLNTGNGIRYQRRSTESDYLS